MIRLVLSFFILLIAIQASHADTLRLDKSTWEERVNDLDYSENADKKESQPKEKNINFQQEEPKSSNSFLDIDSVKTILFGILILAALIVIILIVKNAKAPANIGKDRIQATSLEQAEENLPEVELNNILDEAVSSKNWKIALRIQFLMLLQELIYADQISWKKRKTNEQFAGEITDALIKSEFTRTVNVFDPAWYGNQGISEDSFNEINAVILSLKKRVSHGE